MEKSSGFFLVGYSPHSKIHKLPHFETTNITKIFFFRYDLFGSTYNITNSITGLKTGSSIYIRDHVSSDISLQFKNFDDRIVNLGISDTNIKSKQFVTKMLKDVMGENIGFQFDDKIPRIPIYKINKTRKDLKMKSFSDFVHKDEDKVHHYYSYLEEITSHKKLIGFYDVSENKIYETMYDNKNEGYLFVKVSESESVFVVDTLFVRNIIHEFKMKIIEYDVNLEDLERLNNVNYLLKKMFKHVDLPHKVYFNKNTEIDLDITIKHRINVESMKELTRWTANMYILNMKSKELKFFQYENILKLMYPGFIEQIPKLSKNYFIAITSSDTYIVPNRIIFKLAFIGINIKSKTSNFEINLDYLDLMDLTNERESSLSDDISGEILDKGISLPKKYVKVITDTPIDKDVVLRLINSKSTEKVLEIARTYFLRKGFIKKQISYIKSIIQYPDLKGKVKKKKKVTTWPRTSSIEKCKYFDERLGSQCTKNVYSNSKYCFLHDRVRIGGLDKILKDLDIGRKNGIFKTLTGKERDLARSHYRKNLKSKIPRDSNSTMFMDYNGFLIAVGYKRTVIGDHGAYFEFGSDNIMKKELILKNRSTNFILYTSRAGAVVYKQIAPVKYADYKVGMYYISPYDLKYSTFTKSMFIDTSKMKIKYGALYNEFKAGEVHHSVIKVDAISNYFFKVRFYHPDNETEIDLQVQIPTDYPFGDPKVLLPLHHLFKGSILRPKRGSYINLGEWWKPTRSVLVSLIARIYNNLVVDD